MAGLLSDLFEGKSNYQKIQEERLKFETDPALAEKFVSHMSHQWLPEKKAAKIPVGSNIAKIEKGISSDDPRKTLGSEVLGTFQQDLPRLPGNVRPTEYLTKLYSTKLAERTPAIYSAIQKSDSALPFMKSQIAAMPGYESWRKSTKRNGVNWEFTDPLESAAWGAGGAAAMRVAGKTGANMLAKGSTSMIAKFLTAAGGSMAKTSNPWIKAAGIAAMAIPEMFAFDAVRSVVKSSEWAEQRPIQSEVVSLLGGIVGAASIGKVASKIKAGFAVKQGTEAAISDAAKAATANPNPANILALSSATKEIDAAKRNVLDLITKETGVARPSPSTVQKVNSAFDNPAAMNDLNSASEGIARELIGDELANRKLRADMTNLWYKRDTILRTTDDQVKYNGLVEGGTDPLDALRQINDDRALRTFDEIVKPDVDTTAITEKLTTLGVADADKIPKRIGKKLLKRNTSTEVIETESAISKTNSELSKEMTDAIPVFAEGDKAAKITRIVEPTNGKAKAAGSVMNPKEGSRIAKEAGDLGQLYQGTWADDASRHTLTDPVTQDTYSVLSGESVADALKEVREKWGLTADTATKTKWYRGTTGDEGKAITYWTRDEGLAKSFTEGKEGASILSAEHDLKNTFKSEDRLSLMQKVLGPKKTQLLQEGQYELVNKTLFSKMSKTGFNAGKFEEEVLFSKLRKQGYDSVEFAKGPGEAGELIIFHEPPKAGATTTEKVVDSSKNALSPTPEVVAAPTSVDIGKTFGMHPEGQLAANDYIETRMKELSIPGEAFNPSSTWKLSSEQQGFVDDVINYRTALRTQRVEDIQDITDTVAIIKGGGKVIGKEFGKLKNAEDVENFFNKGYGLLEEGKITRNQFEPFEDAYMERIDKLSAAGKKSKAKSLGPVVAAMAPVAVLGSWMSADQSNANPLTAELKVAPKVAEWAAEMVNGGKKTWKDMEAVIRKTKFFSAPVDPANPKTMPEFMRSPGVAPDITNIAYKGPSTFWMKVAGPYTVAERIYGVMKNGKRVMGDPMVDVATRLYATAPANTARAVEVTQNILGDVAGYKGAANEVIKTMAPLEKQYGQIIGKRGYLIGNIKSIEEELAKLRPTLAKLSGTEKTQREAYIGILQGQFDDSVKKLHESDEIVKEFHASWESTVKPLAARNSGTRIALALEGEGLQDGNAWLAPLLTNDEKVAVGYLRELLDDFSTRMVEVGENPIMDIPYVHHAAHPSANYRSLAKALEADGVANMDNALAYSHFHHRAAGSKQMVPDIEYVMGKYLPDANKRIEMAEFWKVWNPHIQAVKQLGFKGAEDFWDGFKRSFAPSERNTMSKLARVAYSFEVAMRLFLNPSSAFKHLTKLEANWTNFGFKESMKVLPASVQMHLRAVGKDVANGLGAKGTDMYTDVMRTYTAGNRMSSIIADLNMYDPPESIVEKWLQKFNEKGGTLINFTERLDRAHSYVAALEMAAKQGMTAQQAIYGVMDTVIKTNFLNGIMNPTWIRNPYVRMMFMFQGTPFKIFEQRVLLAARAGKDVKKAFGVTVDQLQNLRSDIKAGEKEFKLGLIKDALTSERDMWGNAATTQVMRKMMILGTLIMGGKAMLDADFFEHALHVPFLKKEESGFRVNMNPMVTAAMEASANDDEFWLSSFFGKWFSSGPMPQSVAKMTRLANDDIPELYKESKLKYFFGVPSASKETKE